MDKPSGQTELRILLLEDVPTDAELAENALREAGLSFTARRVDTRETFIRALEEFKPDIVLADYNLPAFDGGSAVKIVRQQYPTIPVVMVTGAMGDEAAIDLLKLGAVDYVLKDRLVRLGPAVQRALSTERGIRARKAAEQALRQSEADLRTLVEHSPIAMLVDVGADADEKIIMMNRKFTELFGYTMEDVPNVHHWWPLAYPDEKYREEIKAEWTARVENAIQRHADIEPMEVTVTCKKGLRRYVRISLASIGNRNIITFEDLTERKRAEIMLRDSEEKFRAIFDGALDGIVLADIETRQFAIGNPAICRMLGYSPEEITRIGVPDIHPQQDLPHTAELFEKLARGEIQLAADIPVKRKDGSVFYADIKGSFVSFGGKNYLAGIFRDITERKAAEQALRKTQETYRSLFDNTLNGVAHVRMIFQDGIPLDMEYLTVNKGFEIVTGLKGVEGRKVSEIIPGYAHDNQEALDVFGRVAQTGKPTRWEHHLAALGRWFSFSIYSPAQGEIVIVSENITERKQAELQLLEQETQYRTLADSGQALIWASDTDKLCNYFNQPWLKFTGRTLEQELGNGWTEGVHPDDFAQCLAIYVAAFDRREPFSMVYRLRHHDGEYRWIQDDGCPRYNAEGKFIGYIGYCLDITERKNAENKLAESEQHFRAVTESANDAIITGAGAGAGAGSGKITGWNAAAERLFGYTEAEIIGQPLTMLMPERFRNLHNEGLARMMAGGVPHIIGKTTELTGLRKDGSEFPLELSLAQWQAADDQFFTAIIRDISERKQAEARIQKLARLYATLSQTNTIIVHSTNRQELFCNICKAAVTHGKFVLAWIGLVDEATQRVRPVCHDGAEEGYLENIAISASDVPEGRGPTGTAIRESRVNYVNNYATDERVWPWRDAALKRGFRGAAGLPLRFGNKVIGALTLYTDEPDFFDADQISLLEEMATDISFALESFEREMLRKKAEEERETALHKLRNALEGSIQVAASISETRDPYTAGHQQRVSLLAEAIAVEMGLPAAQIEGIRFGSLIHDIGKIGVPAEILSKPSNLTPLEMQLIQTHANTGYEIVKDIEFPWPVAQMILQHHERLDGSGYPAGLKDNDIIPEARIIAVADTVEAMSSHRPYRPGLGMDAALAEIAGASGVRYDKQAVEACLRLIREKGFTFQPD